jgi:hypothetical protein
MLRIFFVFPSTLATDGLGTVLGHVPGTCPQSWDPEVHCCNRATDNPHTGPPKQRTELKLKAFGVPVKCN